jgi:hypothetical protein
MKRLLILFVCVALLVVPTFAQSVSITAPSGQAIKYLTIGSTEGTSGTIHFNLNDGSSIDGSWSYQSTLDVGGYTLIRVGNISLEGEEAGTTYVTPGKFYIRFLQVKAMLNGSENTMRGAYGQVNGGWYNWVEVHSPSSPVTSISFVADNDVEYTPEYWSLDNANQNVAGDYFEYLRSIMVLAYETFWDAYAFIGDLIYWVRYFFIDNLTLILALFFAVPMAFAARNSRGDPERFMRQYFKTLRGFFEFIFQVWRLLTETIGTVIGWFKLV